MSESTGVHARAPRETPRIPSAVRVVMARAAVQVLADSVGVDMLHIKGETVDPSLGGVRAPGSDVDAIVDPLGIPTLHRALLAHGWRVYSSFAFGSPFGHAQTYLHEVWGYFDLHRRFPGIGLRDQVSFDLMWAERLRRDAAGIAYATPGVDVQAVVLILNAVRNRRPMPPFWDTMDADDRARCRALVERLHAQVAFAAAEGNLASMRGHREYRLWKATAQGGPRIAEWWARVVAQPSLLGSLRIIAQAPRVNTDRLAHRLGRAPSLPEVVGEFFARGARGVREAALLVVRRRR